MLDTNRLDYMIPEREDGNYTLKDKVIIKITNQYNDFISELYKLSPEEIVNRANEKTIKEEIIYYLQAIDYSPKQYEAMLKDEDLLSELYFEWTSSNEDFYEILEAPIDKYINLLQERNRINRSKDDIVR